MPAAITTRCPSGHEIRSAADRDGQGYCRKCRAERRRETRLAEVAALDVVRVFEAAGVQFQHDGVPVAADEVARQLVAAHTAGLL